MLEKALAETDPDTTDMVVMTAKVAPTGDGAAGRTADLDAYDQQLMTAVVDRAEKAGKQVKPLIVPTNNPLHAVLQDGQGPAGPGTDHGRVEQVHGRRAAGADRLLLDQPARRQHGAADGAHPEPRARRVPRPGGGNRIPKISERQARSVAELRAAGVGVDRVLLLHDGSPANSDLFQAVLTMLDPQVELGLLPLAPAGAKPPATASSSRTRSRRRKLGRGLTVLQMPQTDGPAIVERLRADQYDLVILPLPEDSPATLSGRWTNAPATS